MSAAAYRSSIQRVARGGLSLLLALTLLASARADTPPAPAPPAPPPAVLSATEVTNVLYASVGWYRTLDAQSRSDVQSSDASIIYADRQIAAQVLHLVLDMARADAELLSSEANHTPNAPGIGSSAEALNGLRDRLEGQARQIQAQLQAARAAQPSARTPRGYLDAKVSELEGELTVMNARSNLVATMAQFVNETDAKDAGANALKEHIAAIEASLPSAASATAAVSTSSLAAGSPARRLGIWDLVASTVSVSGKLSALDGSDRSTADLETQYQKLLATPLAAIKSLSARSDALSAEAESANRATVAQVRSQLDTVAWQFKQTAAIVLPLSKARVLLEQYRHNLAGWRAILEGQRRSTLLALGVRLGILALVLATLFAGAELWRQAVLRYEHEPRRRHQWLLVRRFTLWTLVLAVIGFAFVTQLSSIATFAGLITAGLAVAMQNVIVSVVGYFFLIGKYGVRVGDRIQVGEVTGEVVELGLVRMHLMELSAKSNFSPTGRIVAFANSIVFQAGGLFRQIPGVNFAWHDITLTLPAGIDYAAAKQAMQTAVLEVVKQYQDSMIRHSTQLLEMLPRPDANKATPRVQLHFSASEVQANVWYPVYLPRAAEIDERVSQELWKAIASVAAQAAGAHPALSPSVAETPLRQ